MFWLIFGSYILFGMLACWGSHVWLLAKRKEGVADLFHMMLFFPELWFLLVFWPIGLPIALWMAWHEEPAELKSENPGPSVIPTQVSRKMIGQRGVVMRELSPVGEVRIGGVDYEAVAEFGVVGEGEEVVVRSQDSLRLKVGRGES